ncbi:hypothetical protein RAA17_20100 [Komagataeibacter rhaeticus]|nr:hypothetical protein [Komagataeibacter rhaeticus]
MRLPGTLAFRAPVPDAGRAAVPSRLSAVRRPPARMDTPPCLVVDDSVAVDSVPVANAIRRTADDGHVTRAMQMCRDHLARHPVDARIHFLFAVLAWGEGCLAQAEESFRRVIYLCRDHVTGALLPGTPVGGRGRAGGSAAHPPADGGAGPALRARGGTARGRRADGGRPAAPDKPYG